ncbi:MAG TPA: SRPBCC family protein [Saprospiraceae bacterium]|nr:SRPBCC family protein [Saprospiraceae bacterium]HND89144.1 SRPBCC family protein [Saprospiraceae bacterium]
MKALRFLLYTLAGIAFLVAASSFFARTTYYIERSIEIKAPFDTVYPQVRYFKNFEKWSPWHGLDDQQKNTLTGPDGAVGTTYAWDGNEDVGAGSQTIRYVSPDSIHIEVETLRPWKGKGPSFFRITPMGDKTRVTWAYNMYIGRPWNAAAMLTDVNARVGKDWERGLGNLKKLCEKLARKKYRGFEVLEYEMESRYYVGYRQKLDSAGVQAFYDENFPKALKAAKAMKSEVIGGISGLFWTWGDSTDMAATVPIKEEEDPEEGASIFPLGGAQAALIEYYGPHTGTGKAHMAMDSFLADRKLRVVPPMIEEYITDPATEKDTMKWLTKIIYFIAPQSDSLTLEPPAAAPPVKGKKK